MRASVCTVVALTLSLAAQEAKKSEFEERVQKALARARPALLRHLDQAQGNMLALVTLAALHDEIPHDDKVLKKALARLERTNINDTYGLSLRLMVQVELPAQTTSGTRAQADCAELLTHQGESGGFSYSPLTGLAWDLSNTQYAVLGLRAAAALGCKIDASRWRRLLRLLRENQTEDGGFAYHGRQGAYSSMTVAGIAGLEICKQHLDAESLPRDLDGRIAEAWQWLEEHVADIGNPSVRSCLYFHYGLERAAILSGKKDVAGLDWYRKGAEMLIKSQRAGGGWASAFDMGGGDDAGPGAIGNAVDTSFAVLFLRRKFQRTLAGPVTQSTSTPVKALDAQSDERAVTAAIAFDVARHKKAVPELLECLRSDLVVRRRAAALALARISGRDFGYVPYLAPDQQVTALRAAEEWWLTEGKR